MDQLRQAAALVLLLSLGATATAAEPDSFSQLLTSRERETFVAIRNYVTSHATAPDRAAAMDWLFETAPKNGWEEDIISLASEVLERDETNTRVRMVRALARAQLGDPDVTQDLDAYLRTLRLRNPSSAVDFAQALALRFQLRGDPAAAATIYDRLKTGFFLNAEVRDSAEARQNRLKLVGQPPPALAASDLNGKPLLWEDYRDHVVLLDFWATNCRPCVEELPRLVQLHRELHPLRMDVVGISLDEDAETVQSFRETHHLSWRIGLDRQQVTPRYQVALIPCVMLIDRSGNVAATDVLPADWRWAVRRLLK